MAWTNPSGYTANGWSSPENSIDGNTGTSASYDCPTSGSPYLETSFSAVNVDSVRVYTSRQNSQLTTLDIDVYYNSTWNNVYSGTPADSDYVTQSLGGTYSCTGIRVRGTASAGTRDLYIHNIEYNTVVAATTLNGVLVTNTSTFPAADVKEVQKIEPTLVNEGDTFWAGSITQKIYINQLANLNTMGAPQVKHRLKGVLFTNVSSFPVATVSEQAASDTLNGVLVVNTSTFPAADVREVYTLNGVLLTNVSTFPSGGAGGTIDSYDIANQNVYYTCVGVNVKGQCFDADTGGTLDKIALWFYGSDEEVELRIELFAMTGTYGTNGEPTGSVLATSDTIAMTGIDTSPTKFEFPFSGIERITLESDTKYVLTVDPIVSGLGCWLYMDNTSPTHDGNYCASSDGGSNWTGSSGIDVCFEVHVAGSSGPQVKQKLKPVLYTNTSSFPAATVTGGSGTQTLDGVLVVNTSTFPAAKVNQRIYPNLLNEGDTFWAGDVKHKLKPVLYTNTSSFFVATVTAHALVEPILHTNTSSFFVATITRHALVEPTLLTNVNNFPAADISSGTVLEGVLYTNTNSFFDGKIKYRIKAVTKINYLSLYLSTVSHRLKPVLYTNVSSVGQPVLDQKVKPVLHTNSSSFPAATVTRHALVEPVLFTNVSSFPPANVQIAGAPQTLDGVLVTNVSIFPVASVIRYHTVRPYTVGGEDTIIDKAIISAGGIASSFSGVRERAGTSFKGFNGDVVKAAFSLAKGGNPTGNCFAALYQLNGAIKTANGKPATDATPLGVSDTVDVSTLSTLPVQWVEFTFSTSVTLSSVNDYAICFVYTGGDSSNYVWVSSENTAEHLAGNKVYSHDSSSWVSSLSSHHLFKLYADTSTETFPVASVVSYKTIKPALFTNVSVFPAAQVTADKLLNGVLVTNTSIIPQGKVNQKVYPTLLTNISTFYTAELKDQLKPVLIPSSTSFFASVVHQRIKGTLFTNISTVFAPDVGSFQMVRPVLHTNVNIFFGSQLNTRIKSVLITSTTSFNSPKVNTRVKTVLFTNISSFYAPYLTYPKGSFMVFMHNF